MTTIVFSKDRPLQLFACLHSLQKIGSDITVIFRTSNATFQEAYAILQGFFLDVVFVDETDRGMGQCIRDCLSADFLMFT